MLLSFSDRATEDIYNGDDTKKARRACPPQLWKGARRKLDMIRRAKVLSDLARPPKNRLEALRGNREGQHSIRINDQYRICFRWTDEGADDVEIVDYHRRLSSLTTVDLRMGAAQKNQKEERGSTP